MEVKAEFKYNPIGSFKHSNPFCIAFVYPSKSKPFILKGGLTDVETWFGGFKEPAVVHRTYWYKHMRRVYCEIINTVLPIIIANKAWYSELWESANIDKRKNVALVAGYKYESIIVAMKRLPRKWIKELNPYIPKEYVKDKKPASRPTSSRKGTENQDLRMIRLSE